MDVNKDGIDECVIIETVSGRCESTQEVYNEQTKRNEVQTVKAVCDLRDFNVFQQKRNGFLDYGIEKMDLPNTGKHNLEHTSLNNENVKSLLQKLTEK
jgi:hypothetical protein